MHRRRSAGSGVNSAFAEGRFADTEVDGAGRLAGGLGVSRDACGRVSSTRPPCTVDKVLARYEPLTNFAVRAAAVGKSPSLRSPAGEVSRRLATGLESFYCHRNPFLLLIFKTSRRAYEFCLEKTISRKTGLMVRKDLVVGVVLKNVVAFYDVL